MATKTDTPIPSNSGQPLGDEGTATKREQSAEELLASENAALRTRMRDAVSSLKNGKYLHAIEILEG